MLCISQDHFLIIFDLNLYKTLTYILIWVWTSVSANPEFHKWWWIKFLPWSNTQHICTKLCTTPHSPTPMQHIPNFSSWQTPSKIKSNRNTALLLFACILGTSAIMSLCYNTTMKLMGPQSLQTAQQALIWPQARECCWACWEQGPHLCLFIPLFPAIVSFLPSPFLPVSLQWASANTGFKPHSSF